MSIWSAIADLGWRRVRLPRYAFPLGYKFTSGHDLKREEMPDGGRAGKP